MSIGLYKRCTILVFCLAQPQTFIAKMTTSKSKSSLAAQSSHASSKNANAAKLATAKKSKSSASTSAQKVKRELIGEQPGKYATIVVK